MKEMFGIGVAVAAVLASAPCPQALFAQACKDEQAMIDEFRQGLAGTVDTVKKETLESFEKAFHQKTCLTKLTLSLNIMDEAINCFDKASQDTTATKEQTASYKALKDSYAKLKDKLSDYKSQLKGVEAPKQAKALIEKFDFAK